VGSLKQRSFSDDAGYIVGLALLIILLVNAGAGAVVARIASKPGLRADAVDYLEFGLLYLSTFLLSLTLTIAVAAYAVPRIYGYAVAWWVPVAIVVVGGYLTGLPVALPQSSQLPHPRLWVLAWSVSALRAFAELYGPAFFGGTVVGAAGGLLMAAAAHRRRTGSGDGPERQSQPWAGTVVLLIVGVVAAALALTVAPGPVGAAVAGPPTTPARAPATPAPTVRVIDVSWGPTDANRQSRYHLTISFVGLRGENCRVVWRTVYIEPRGPGGTSGEVWTGVLAHDNNSWTIDNLVVTAPTRRARWGTHFDVYCRGILMATR
jgi:hypothetical protein